MSATRTVQGGGVRVAVGGWVRMGGEEGRGGGFSHLPGRL